MLIDAHNHLQDARLGADSAALVAEMRVAGVTSCVVNGTEPADWTKVAALAEQYPNFVIPSFGLHPWKLRGRSPQWESQLHDFLTRFPNAGVGEFGLDRWIKDFNIQDQRTVFRAHLKTAIALDRWCTVHCLKAWGGLLEELSMFGELPNILIHSFSGSIETANQLAALGCYFSFSGYFLHRRKQSVVDVFAQLPVDRILVETDAPDMLPPESDRPFGGQTVNHPANLLQIQNRLSELIGISRQQLVENTLRWLG